MNKHSTKDTAQVATNVVRAFLDAPPQGTPGEIVDAFTQFCDCGDESLSGHLFFQLVEQAPIALSITDEQARIVYANRMFEEVTGYSREEVIGDNESILSNQATPATLYQDMWSTLCRKHTWAGTLVNRRRDGDSYLAELIISPVLDGTGEITHFLGMHRDITEVHALQQRFARQKGLLESILDTAPVVVALMDAQHRVLLDNQEYKKLFGDLRGAEPAEVLLKAVHEQGPPLGSEQKGAGRDVRDVEVRLEFSSGEPRWFECSVLWLDDMDPSVTSYFKSAGRESVCLLLASETTRQRREYERARMEQLRAGLAEEQRISGMREAIAAATFQIQQPLNLINAATAMLRHRGEDNGHLLETLEQIGASAREAFDTMRAALPVADEEPLQRLNLNATLHEVLELSTSKLLKHGIVIDWRPSTVLSVFSGRATQIRALLMSLIDNAILALDEAKPAQKLLSIRSFEDNGLLSVSIQDNGAGIAADKRLTVFQPLYCGWRQKAGHAGMGLSMAQDIANRHGGCIVVDDRCEQGCRMRFEVPTKRPDIP